MRQLKVYPTNKSTIESTTHIEVDLFFIIIFTLQTVVITYWDIDFQSLKTYRFLTPRARGLPGGVLGRVQICDMQQH